MSVDEQTEQVGNWGRWGADDERGTLNLLTPEVVLRASQTCKTGKVYSLALPIQADGVPLVPYRGTPMRLTLVNHTDDVMFEEAFGAKDVGANEDILVFASHNETHMDALCHVHHQAKFYNGFPSDGVRTNGGAQKLGIDKTRWVVGRAVMLDLAAYQQVDCLPDGHVITGDELLACAAAQEVELGAGDILLLRTGWIEKFLADPTQELALQPGIGFDAARLIGELDLAAVGADNSAVEAIPFDGDQFLGVHIKLLVELGLPLLEHLVLTEMAADKVYESLLVVAPLPVRGGTGSPINPIAIG